MRVLISHTNFPAQFRRLAPALVEQGHEVVFIAKNREWHAPDPVSGMRIITYGTHRSGGSEVLHPYLRRFETSVLEGQAVFRACQKLREEGWLPDWILNHVGFGNGLYLSDAFPNAKRIGLFEWYYRAVGADVDFLKQAPVEPDRALRLRTWNAQTLLELADCDVGVVPTRWQCEQFPAHLASRLRVIHEGIDVEALGALERGLNQRPDVLPNDPEIEVLTYVSRGFEEYRGFPQAMKAIALLQQRRPNLHVLIVGNGAFMGRPDGRSWGDWANRICLRSGRTHWLGTADRCLPKGACNAVMCTFTSRCPLCSAGVCWRPWPQVVASWPVTRRQYERCWPMEIRASWWTSSRLSIRRMPLRPYLIQTAGEGHLLMPHAWPAVPMTARRVLLPG